MLQKVFCVRAETSATTLKNSMFLGASSGAGFTGITPPEH